MWQKFLEKFGKIHGSGNFSPVESDIFAVDRGWYNGLDNGVLWVGFLKGNRLEDHKRRFQVGGKKKHTSPGGGSFPQTAEGPARSCGGRRCDDGLYPGPDRRLHNAHAAGDFHEVCNFCNSKKVTPPNWDKRAMSVLLTKYNSIGLSASEPITITYQLNKRCKNLPEKVSLAYFVKALDMQEQYKAVTERAKQAKQFKENFGGFAF